MMRTIARWVRVVLPNTDLAWLSIVVHLAIEALYLVTLWNLQPDELAFRRIRLGYLSVLAGVYGLSRVLVFHPVMNDQYKQWLQSVPWTAGQPLPAGPLALVPQDIVIVGVLTALGREPSAESLAIPLSFLICYLGCLAISARLCGDWSMAYLLGAGLITIGLADTKVGHFVTAIAFCPISLIAAQRSLARFPWTFNWEEIAKRKANPGDSGSRMGWPHDYLAPVEPRRWVPLSDGICGSLLAAWAVFVIEWNGGYVIVFIVVLQAITLSALSRLYYYTRSHYPPVSLWGRLRTRQWIIPRYDTIFVAPALAVVTIVASQALTMFWLLPAPLQRFPRHHIPAMLLSCGGVFVSSLLLSVAGPCLERWRLNAPHRIVFDATSRQSQSPFLEL